MNTESPESRAPRRFQLATDSLKREISMLELSYMLVQACEEVVSEGGIPETDPAVALISGRISFASPADTMSSQDWDFLVHLCANGIESRLELNKAAIQ